MVGFDEQDVQKALDLKVQHLGPDDIERVVQNAATVRALIDELPAELGRARSQATLLFDFVRAHAEARDGATGEAVAQAVGALLYLSAPLDLVPDTEAAGYDDDAAILELAVQRIAPELRRFCAGKGVDPASVL